MQLLYELVITPLGIYARKKMKTYVNVTTYINFQRIMLSEKSHPRSYLMNLLKKLFHKVGFYLFNILKEL